MVNAICFCDLLEVSCFKILLWPMDKNNCYNENAFKSVVFKLFHLQTNKKFPKEVKAQCSLFKCPNNRLIFSLLSPATLHMQWVCKSQIEKHHSGNSYCFSLSSINFSNKKRCCLLQRERGLRGLISNTIFAIAK